jgi:hypothetical protein
MKNLYKLILGCGILCIVFASCKKDSDSSNSSALSGNKITGKISNWSYGSDKKMVAYAASSFNETVGLTTISSDGSFQLTLSNPTTSSLESIWDYFDETLAISDPSAKCTDLLFEIEDAGGNYFGYVDYSTYSVTGLTNGAAFVEYFFSTNKTSIKGTLNDSYAEFSEKGVFDLNLNQGWNTVVTQVTKYVETNTTLTVEYKVGNSEPSNVKWIYYSDKKKKAAKIF